MPKNWRKKKILSKSVSVYYKTKKNRKKWHGPISHWCREGKTLVVRPLKKNTFFMCVFPKKLLFFSQKRRRKYLECSWNARICNYIIWGCPFKLKLKTWFSERLNFPFTTRYFSWKSSMSGLSRLKSQVKALADKFFYWRAP